MFRVLTHRRKSRLTSPRFVAGSIAAHAFAALVVVSVSRAGPLPPPPVQTDTTIWDVPRPSDPPPPPPVEPARPMREGSTKELVAPTVVPRGITEPDPTEPSIDPRDYTGDGPIGDTIVARPRTSPADPPAGDQPPMLRDFSRGPLPGEYADTRPMLSNTAEAGRLLQRHYPPVYADAGVAGLTVVEIVVEANGRVRPGSARVVESSHPQFGDAALRIIERFRFQPATVGEEPVAVSVQIPIHWRPAN